MAYLTLEETVSLLFKVLQGFEEGNKGKFFFEESPLDQRIWTQKSQIPVTAPALNDGESSGVVTKRVALPLTQVPGNSNAFTHPYLKEAIHFKHGDGSFDWTLVDNNDQPIPKGQYSWLKSPNSSVLYFYQDAPGNMPPKITFFQYTGTKDEFGTGVGSGDADNKYRGLFDPDPGVFPTEGSGSSSEIKKGDFWRMSADGEFASMTPETKVKTGDLLFAAQDEAVDPDHFFAIQRNVDLSAFALSTDARFNTANEKLALTASESPGTTNPFITKSYLDAVIYALGLNVLGADMINNTPDSIVVGNKTAHKAVMIEFTIKRDTLIEVGTLRMSNRETDTWVSHKSELDDCGFTFSKSFDGDDIKLNWVDDLANGNDARIDMIAKFIPL